jgi:hypothetical protein
MTEPQAVSAAAVQPAYGWPAGTPDRSPYPWPAATDAAPAPGRFTRFVHRLAARMPTWAAPVGILGCFVGASAYVLATDPTDAPADALPTCVLKLTTGFDCPGCGGTRAFWYVLHANLPAAARHHAIFVFALPFLVYLYVSWAGQRVFGWRLPALRIGPRVLVIFLVAWGVFTVVRNLPWAPFTSLYV